MTQSIRQCTDIPLAKNKKPTTTSMSQLFRDRETLAYALKELEFRVESRRKPEKQTSKDRKKGEDNTASRQRSKESAIAMTDAERKGTTSVDMRPPARTKTVS